MKCLENREYVGSLRSVLHDPVMIVLDILQSLQRSLSCTQEQAVAKVQVRHDCCQDLRYKCLLHEVAAEIPDVLRMPVGGKNYMTNVWILIIR